MINYGELESTPPGGGGHRPSKTMEELLGELHALKGRMAEIEDQLLTLDSGAVPQPPIHRALTERLASRGAGGDGDASASGGTLRADSNAAGQVPCIVDGELIRSCACRGDDASRLPHVACSLVAGCGMWHLTNRPLHAAASRPAGSAAGASRPPRRASPHPAACSAP